GRSAAPLSNIDAHPGRRLVAPARRASGCEHPHPRSLTMKINLRTLSLLALVAPAFGAAGCSSTRYGDPKDTETVNIDWGSTDLQTMTAKMTEQLKNSPALAYFDRPNKEADKRVICYMGKLANQTSEHINTTAIT